MFMPSLLKNFVLLLNYNFGAIISHINHTYMTSKKSFNLFFQTRNQFLLKLLKMVRNVKPHFGQIGRSFKKRMESQN